MKSNLRHKEQADEKRLRVIFKNNFNDHDFEGIYALFSNSFKESLIQKEIFELLENLKKDAGSILQIEFEGYLRGTFASYKTSMEDGIYSVNISSDKTSKINGIFIEPYRKNDTCHISRNITKIDLPFEGEWTVKWGGDSKSLNHHIISRPQKSAFDFLITSKAGKSYKNQGRTNEDYYAFSKEIVAPCDGVVTQAVDGVPDNIPGEKNPMYAPGNSLIIKTIHNEFIFFAHFKQSSICVNRGEKILRGQLLGLCGNSGNSTEPHLHFHIQDSDDLNLGNGVKCFFNRIMVTGNLKSKYSPIKGDKVQNII